MMRKVLPVSFVFVGSKSDRVYGTKLGGGGGGGGGVTCLASIPIAAVCEGKGQTNVESCYQGNQKNRAAQSGI